jgi:DNA polymerase
VWWKSNLSTNHTKQIKKGRKRERLTDISEIVADVREQVLCMQELGVDVLAVETGEKVISHSSVDSSKLKVESSRNEAPFAKSALHKPEMPVKPRTSRLPSLPSLSKRQAVRPDTQMNKPKEPEEFPIVEEIMQHVSSPVVEEVLAGSADTIESIRTEIGDCTRCPLHAQGRTQIIHTTGNFQADLMFVGEAPGADEDEQGFPFVGRAGRLLTDIIKAMGFERENVCIGNINRCRPPGNRKPELEETAACRPFLLREIAVVRPKVIVVLGATAAHNLLQVKTPITKMRGEFHDYFGAKVMPTFHPAYLLRDPHKKKDVWEDMKKVRDYLTGSTK